MNKKLAIFASVSVIGVVLDQLTKYWVRANIELGERGIDIIPGWVQIVHAENPGAAGGFLRSFEYRHFVFFGFFIIATGIILDMWRRLKPDDAFLSLTLGLIMSGAMGNVVDRVAKPTHTVTDFVRVYTEWPPLRDWLYEKVHTTEWPSFNVADAALVVGVGLFLMHDLFLEEKEDKKAPVVAEPEAPPA